MKKLLSAFVFTVLASAAAVAQCDKTVEYHSNKQEIINANGDIEHTEEDEARLEFTKEKLTVSIQDKEGVMTANIKETDCQWKKKYVEGKVFYKLDFIKPDSGEAMPGTITIEGKDGALTIILTFEKEENKKVRILIDKYEEK